METTFFFFFFFFFSGLGFRAVRGGIEGYIRTFRD